MMTILQCDAMAQDVSNLKLKDYRPVSIYNTPQTEIARAKFPVIDVHAHDYAKTASDVDAWVKTMDELGIEKTIILSGATGKEFDAIVARYKRHKDRFDVWCGFDYTGYGTAGWQTNAVAELVRCYKAGAKGVGELGDKGLGEIYSTPVKGYGLHLDGPELKPLLAKCGELGMPVNIHVAEDEWMYLPADSTNDGLMNAAKWKVDMSKKGILNHEQLIATLENAVRNNPKTIFIACHLANCCADLSKLARLLDKYPNLYADIAARYGELAPIPRHVQKFMEKYADRLLYGTDMGTRKEMYKTTFRILETSDEHFYRHDLFSYHWPLYGLNLSASTLKKLYNANARKLFSRN
jgi:predicted TIM-barrel fold metal-dependent hydrolase